MKMINRIIIRMAIGHDYNHVLHYSIHEFRKSLLSQRCSLFVNYDHGQFPDDDHNDVDYGKQEEQC